MRIVAVSGMLMIGAVVAEAAPLAPGTYLLAAGIENSQTGKEALAITFFTVEEGRSDSQAGLSLPGLRRSQSLREGP